MNHYDPTTTKLRLNYD